MRKLVKIVKIDDIIEHPQADRLEIAQITGWSCVVRKGIHKVGDYAIYFENDCLLPTDRPIFSFLKNDSNLTLAKRKYHRVKAMRLRGVLSHGLLIPVTEYPAAMELSDDPQALQKEFEVVKYEKDDFVSIGEFDEFPSFLRKTDQERYQNIPQEQYEQWIKDGLTFEITVKLEGSSFIGFWFNGEFGVCMRNCQLKNADTGHHYMRWAEKVDLKNRLKTFCEENGMNIAVQGEMVGPKVQGNFECLPERNVFFFDIYDIDKKRLMTPFEARAAIRSMGLDYVPVLDEAGSLPGYKTLGTYADGIGAFGSVIREGVVFKCNERNLSFKAHSDIYLETYD